MTRAVPTAGQTQTAAPQVYAAAGQTNESLTFTPGFALTEYEGRAAAGKPSIL